MCSVQVGNTIVIVDVDTDPGLSGVSTLVAREANRACQRQRFESEMPEEREDRLVRRRARRRERITSETAKQREMCFTADRARSRQRITSVSAEQREICLSRRRGRSAEQVSQECEAPYTKDSNTNHFSVHTIIIASTTIDLIG